MSLKTRLGLLAGSSLAVAGLMALVPGTAAAQTCTPTAVTVSGSSAAADAVNCSAGVFPTGITYSSSGDLSVSMVANGATVNSTMTANGVNLTANGADAVTWNSAIGAVTGGAGTAGPIIDATSVSGAISITTGAVIGSQAGTTQGIRATSTGGGSIAINATGAVNNNVAGGIAAIQAVTNGGAVSITKGSTGNLQGRLRGILAQTSGAGTINVTVGGAVSASTIDGQAGIDTIAGTGATTITLNGGTTSGGAGAAIRSVSGGAVAVVLANSANISGRVDFSGVAGGATITSTGGYWQASGASVFSAAADVVNLSAVNQSSLASGASIDFGAGDDLLTLGVVYVAEAGTIDFGVGADRLTVAANVTATGTAVLFGAGADTLAVTGALTLQDGTIDFGGDNDAVNLSGVLIARNTPFLFGAGTDTLTQSGLLFWDGATAMSNLEVFNNTGAVYFGGGPFVDQANIGPGTDLTANDALYMTSGTYTGSGGSRFVLDANLGNAGSQIGCSAPTSADCVNFTGATTAGSTLLTVRDSSLSVNGGTLNAVITLVEGSTAAENFIIDPNSTFYAETTQGPGLRKPVVGYYFAYDDANHRHVLISAPTDEPFQIGTFAVSAQEAWRATAGTWLTRQADLRATPGGLEPSRGFWGRAGAQTAEREVSVSYAVQGLSLDFDLNQKQRIAHVSFGADLVGGPGWVVGAMAGFVRSDVEFEATPTEASLTGANGGVYASYVAGPLFMDGLFNLNLLHIKAEAPQMGLGLDVPLTFDLKSLGGQVEAGWRIGMESGLFVEPLLGASYVITRFDDAEVPGGAGVFSFENTKSLRIGAGGRLGLDTELAGMTASYSLTGRYWNDVEGQGSATVTTASGSSALLPDDFSGGFGEVAGSLNLFSQDGGVSSFVDLGGKFADGYQSIDGSVGVRVRW